MDREPTRTWHGALYRLSYTMFGRAPPERADGPAYAAAVAGALVFVTAAALICAVLNVFTLIFGVFAEPVWRNEARFRFLTLPGGIPVIALAVPVLAAYGIYRSWILDGPLFTFGPWVVTTALGVALLGAFIAFNRWRRRQPPAAR